MCCVRVKVLLQMVLLLRNACCAMQKDATQTCQGFPTQFPVCGNGCATTLVNPFFVTDSPYPPTVRRVLWEMGDETK